MIKKILFFLYLLLITFLSLLPSRDLPDVKLFLHADKVIHLCMYAGFTFLLLWAWPQKFTGIRQLIPLPAIILYGLLMEAIQGLTHLGSSFDLTDQLANILGFLPGWVGWKIISKFEARCVMRDARKNFPGRAVRYLPAPPQIRTSGFPASGSSFNGFANDSCEQFEE